MGRVSVLPPSTGYRILTLRAAHTLAETAELLNADGLPTASGAAWTSNTVAKVQRRLNAQQDAKAGLSWSVFPSGARNSDVADS